MMKKERNPRATQETDADGFALPKVKPVAFSPKDCSLM